MTSLLTEQENFGIIIFKWGDWRILDSNQKGCAIFEQPCSQLKGKRLKDLIHIPKEIYHQLRNAQVGPSGPIVETPLFLRAHSPVVGIFGRFNESSFYLLFFPLKDEAESWFLPKLRYLFRNIRFAGIMLDKHGTLLFCTQMLSKYTKYHPEEIIGKNFFESLLSDSEGPFLKELFQKKTYENLLPETIQIALRKKDGTILNTLWNFKPLFNGKQQFVGIAGLGIDLKILQIETQKTLPNEKLENIIASISSMFAQIPTYKVDEAIHKTLKMVGEYANVDRSYVFLFRENQQIMDNTHEWCAPGIEPQIENLQNVPSKIVPWWMKHLLKHEIIHIPRVSELPPEASEEKEILQAQDIQSLIVVPMLEKKDLIGFIGFDSVRLPKFWEKEDINLLKIVSSIFVSALIRKKTELSLAEAERKYHTLFTTAPDLIFILNRKGKIEALNPAFSKITGHKVEDWVGKSFFEIVARQDRELFKRNFQNCLNGNLHKPFEIRLQTSANLKIIEMICSQMTFSGKTRGIYGIGRDITDRKTLEENLQHAERMKSIGLLAGGIAHDFNNILGIIQGNYTILRNKLNQVGQLDENLESIRQAVERGKTLVQNLLTFARKKEPNFELLDLNSELKNIVNLLKQTTPKSIKYRMHLSNESLFLFYDRTQIHQLFLNLCLNAIDAIRTKKKSGKIFLKTQKTPAHLLPSKFKNEAKEQSYVHLLIKDDGIGISDEAMKHIFDPFFTSKESGNGLGLAVVFGIVKGLHGQIDVQSEVGQGTTFHLYLPLATRQKIVPMVAKHQNVKAQLFFGGARIFLIEDDPLLNQMLFHLLETNGYQVKRAYAGDKAIEMYMNIWETIDLVILDFDLPEKDGFDVAKQFMALNPQVKIIMTSGFIEPEIKQQLNDLENISFFEKPYDPEQILKTIPTILNNKKQ